MGGVDYPEVKRIKLCGVWARETKIGTVISGKLSYGTTLLIMPNTFKETDKQPDYIAYIEEFKPKEETPVNEG